MGWDSACTEDDGTYCMGIDESWHEELACVEADEFKVGAPAFGYSILDISLQDIRSHPCDVARGHNRHQTVGDGIERNR